MFQIRGQNPVLNFFARHYPKLQKEWETTLEERLERSTRQNLERIEPDLQITPSGENWFDFNISYNTQGGQRFTQADIQRLLLSGQSHTRLSTGKIALLDTEALDEFREVLLDCSPRQQAGSYRMDNAHAGFLQASVERCGWQAQAPLAWNQKAAVQRGQAKAEPPPLGALDSVLRPYQKQGTAWLHFLRTNGFGGILADEMGLGKTVQVLAHVWSLRASGDSLVRPTAPVLVVCPSSLVFNWAAEAAKFTPDLKVVAVHGPERHEAFARLEKEHLVITSYALLRRDFEHYRKIQFDTVVLDEAQHIKNRETQNAQAVKAVPAKHRLVLTGTPLENSVLDLWSIFDFLMPGYLGTAKDFRERYEVPITREKSAAVQERLSRRVRPFLLRRLKREVAADLPEKIEQVSYCELTNEQRTLYEQVLEASRSEILKSTDANRLARSRMLVLTALLRLRQICCDPRLLKLEQASTTPDDGAEVSAASGPGISMRPPTETSGKVELFGELLEEVLDGGHRVLVFSQFTSMLQLLREQLQKQVIECCYLDGSTPDRAAVVNRFQKDATVPVFLISLKAGGVGLNLTGADTVIHFDPWWNPAVEAQATDRAHRIGQEKVVTSYKLITRGTVEEKILHLQTRKRALLQGMLGDEAQFARALEWEEIRELLE
jgi:SNF2 family DNA or RNA helicase